jgi:hypothetical protein
MQLNIAIKFGAVSSLDETTVDVLELDVNIF